VLASQIIGMAAVSRGFKVTVGETFGLSQRGGAVMSHIRLSGEKMYGPLIPPNKAHIILGLEPLEALRILQVYGNLKTTFLVNSRPIFPLNVIAGDVDYPDLEQIKSVLRENSGKLYWLDATQRALELGGPIYLNTIMLGALCTLPDFPLTTDDLRMAMKEVFPDTKLEDNDKAMRIGQDLMMDHEN
jgi:indolepyruvate ferredoxin oxidoreductase, beta subunit